MSSAKRNQGSLFFSRKKLPKLKPLGPRTREILAASPVPSESLSYWLR